MTAKFLLFYLQNQTIDLPLTSVVFICDPKTLCLQVEGVDVADPGATSARVQAMLLLRTALDDCECFHLVEAALQTRAYLGGTRGPPGTPATPFHIVQIKIFVQVLEKGCNSNV